MSARSHVVLASLFGFLDPLFTAGGWVLAGFFAVIPNYIVAISLMTIAVMIITAPLTVKSTKSMMAMQRLQPEIKKLQQKHKGDRETLNEELMKLYRENGANPMGGCLPIVIQWPFFLALYSVIRGLTNTVTVNGHKVAEPKYLNPGTAMYHHIQQTPGQLMSWGIDLASKPFVHHGSIAASLPYWGLFAAAIGLQYLQMARLNHRNKGAQINPQMQAMQRFFPLIFGVIYIAFPIAITIYFIVSTLCRIVIQEILFHSGVTKPPPAAREVSGGGAEKSSPAAPKRPARRTLMDRLADAQESARTQRDAQSARRAEIEQETQKASPPAGASSGGAKSPPDGRPPAKRPAAASSKTPTNGSKPAAGAQPRPTKAKAPTQPGTVARPVKAQNRPPAGKPAPEETPAKTANSRARDKRPRKAR